MPLYKRDSGLAITSLVCGLVGWTFVPFIGAIAAIITGHLAKKEIRDSRGTLNGNGMALAGLILGYVQIGLILLSIICFIIFFTALVPVFEHGSNTFSAFLPIMM
jgi:hypothetical protein